MPFLGTFYRLESGTQTAEDAVAQTDSGEVWGRTPRYGLAPTVQAYAGLIPDRRGIEFETTIEPHPTGSPLQAHWYLGRTPGVEERYKDGEQFASIKASVTNHQLVGGVNG